MQIRFDWIKSPQLNTQHSIIDNEEQSTQKVGIKAS